MKKLRRMISSSFLVVLLASSGGVLASVPETEQLVLPPGAENVEGGNSSPMPFRGERGRLQQLYPQSYFAEAGGPMRILAVSFRPDSNQFGKLQGTYDITLSLSTTSRSGQQLRPEFWEIDNNHGADRLIVFSGAIAIDAVHPGGDGPASMGVVIPFQSAFTYDPSAGNLLLDIAQVQIGGVGGDIDIFHMINDAAIVDNNQVLSRYMLATEFGFTVVPEPSMKVLILTGFVVLTTLKRRKL